MSSNFNKAKYVGNKYGFLVVNDVYENPNCGDNKFIKYIANCTCTYCGRTNVEKYLYQITSGNTVSCGCVREYSNSRAGKFERYMNYYVYLDPHTVRVFFNNEPDKSMIVDTSTWIYLNKYVWSYHKSSGYASTNLEDGKFAAYHYLILECPDGYVRDHINRDRLDNRLCNLRVVNQKANCINRTLIPPKETGKIGVTYDKGRKKPYRAQITYRDENNIKRKKTKNFELLDDAIAYRKQLEDTYYKIESLTTKKLNYEPNAIGVVEFRPDNYDQIPPYDFKSHPIV